MKIEFIGEGQCRRQGGEYWQFLVFGDMYAERTGLKQGKDFEILCKHIKDVINEEGAEEKIMYYYAINKEKINAN